MTDTQPQSACAMNIIKVGHYMYWASLSS